MVSSTQLPLNRLIQAQSQSQPFSLEKIKPGVDHGDPRYLQAEKFLYSVNLDMLEQALIHNPHEVNPTFGMSLIEAMAVLVKTPYIHTGCFNELLTDVFKRVIDGLIILARHHRTLEHLTLLFQGHDKIVVLANKRVVFPQGGYLSRRLELDVVAGLFFDMKLLKQFFQSSHADLAIKNAGLCYEMGEVSRWFDLDVQKTKETLSDIAGIPQQMLVHFTNASNMSLIHVLLLKYLHTDGADSHIAAELISQLLSSRFKHYHQSDEEKLINQRLIFALTSFSFRSMPKVNQSKQEWLKQLFFHFFNTQILPFKNDNIHDHMYGTKLIDRDYTRHVIEVTALIAHHHGQLKGVGLQNTASLFEQLVNFDALKQVLQTLSPFIKSTDARQWLYQQYVPKHKAQSPGYHAHQEAFPEFIIKSQSPLTYALYYKGETFDEKLYKYHFSVEFWNELKEIRQLKSFEIASPLVHQALFFTSHDKHLDIEIKEELKEAFIHQLFQAGKKFFCLDNTTYEHWFSAADALPSFITVSMIESPVMIVDEATLGPQAREFLNGVKDRKYLQNFRRSGPLLVISLVTPGSRRTTALTSRSMQISERDINLNQTLLNQTLKAPKKHTFDGLPRINQINSDQANKNSLILDVENMDDFNEVLTRLSSDLRFSGSSSVESLVIKNAEKSLTFFQLCAYAEKLKISLTLLNTHALPALHPFQGSVLHNGYFVDRNSFAQVLQSQISIEKGVLASNDKGPLQVSLTGKNMLQFQSIYALDQLSQEQLNQLQQYRNNRALPALQVYQLGQQTADVSRLKPIDVKNALSGLPSQQQVSLWYTSGVFNLKSFKGFKLTYENCLWLHAEDQFNQLNTAIEPLESVQHQSDGHTDSNSEKTQLYIFVEGRFKTLLQNPDIRSGRTPLFIVGLDRFPELQPHFLSLFTKDAYISTFGRVEFLRKLAPNAKIHFIVSEPLKSLPLAHYSGKLVSSSGLLPAEVPEAWPGFSKLTSAQQAPWKASASNTVSRKDVFKTLAQAYVDPKQRAITVLGGVSSGKRSLIDAGVLYAHDQSLTLDAGLWGQPQFFEILERWATQKNARVRLPLIIENATTQKDWSLFQELFSDKPSIRIKGKHYSLKPQHLLIAKGHLPPSNRSHYVPLLAEHSFTIQVPPITDPELLSEVINPILNAYPQVDNAFKKALREDLIELHKTAEQILGVGAVTAKQLETITIHAVALVARSHRFEIERDGFDRSVSPLEALQLLVKTQYMSRASQQDASDAFKAYFHESSYLFGSLKSLRIPPLKQVSMAKTQAVKHILQILDLAFNLREDLTPTLLKSTPAGFPNNRCLIFAGPPGIGKDETVRAFLQKNSRDFIYINANQDLDWTLQQILIGAEKGYPVVVSEADLVASIFEGIVSGVLQGSLPNGNPVHPGFMLILTINGTALVGREQFTASFLNKSLLVNLPELDDEDLAELTQHHLFKEYYHRRNDLHSPQERFEFYFPDLKAKLSQIPPRIINKILIEMAYYKDPETIRRWYDLDQYSAAPVVQKSKSKQTITPFDIRQIKPKDWIGVSRHYDIEWPVAKPHPFNQTHGGGAAAAGRVGSSASATRAYTYGTPFKLHNFGKEEADPQIGEIINDYDNPEVLRKAGYLIEYAEDSKGKCYSLQQKDLIDLPLDKQYITRIGYYVSLNDAQDFNTDRKYKAWQLLLPLEFGPVPGSVVLKMTLGQEERQIQGSVIPDANHFVYGIFDQNQMKTAQEILNKGQKKTQLMQFTLQYSFAPVIRKELELRSAQEKSKTLKSIKPASSSESRTAASSSQTGKSSLFSRFSGHKGKSKVQHELRKAVSSSAGASRVDTPKEIKNPQLFKKLPVEVKNMVMTINTAVAQKDVSMTGRSDRTYSKNLQRTIETQLELHRQTTLYPNIEDPALDAEYASSELVPGDLKASQAMTYFTLKRGQCTHAAQAWNWLFKTFTDLDVMMVGGFANQSKKRQFHAMKGSHSMIAVTLGQEPVLFDPTTYRETTELYKPLAKEDLSQVFRVVQHEKVISDKSETSKSKEAAEFKRTAELTAIKPVELVYKAPRTLDFLLKREERLLTFDGQERLIFDQLLKPVLKDLEQLVTGKGVSFSSSGDTIAPHRIGKSRSIFAKTSVRTQTGYKHLVLKEFKADAQLILLQPMLIQALINAGVRIYAPIGEYHEFQEVISAEDLFKKPRVKNTEVPAQLQGENAVNLDSFNIAYSKHLQTLGSRLQQEALKQQQKPEIMIAALTARHFRGWMLKPFTEIRADVKKSVKEFNPKKPIKNLPVSVLGVKPNTSQILEMAARYEL